MSEFYRLQDCKEQLGKDSVQCIHCGYPMYGIKDHKLRYRHIMCGGYRNKSIKLDVVTQCESPREILNRLLTR